MEVNHRFSIASYMGGKSEKSTLDGINSSKFSQLISKSQNSIQARLDNPDLQAVFKNKSVSMLFLDKISNLIGKHHPSNLEAKNFMSGPSFFPSLELIRHLSDLLKNESLSENSVQNIKKWIASEQACLPICLIFDAWSASCDELVFQTTTKGGFPDTPMKQKVELPSEEVEIFSNALAHEMKSMQPGEKFKMPAGSLQHVTRLEFIKNSDGTFDILHFNTGLGSLYTACKYSSIPTEKIEDPVFFKQLVEAKMQSDMKPLNDLLNNLAKPEDIDKLMKKQLQLSNSCSFHAAEAEFKHSFITSFESREEGWISYKQCTSLMASEAVKNEVFSLEPSIEQMLVAKEQVRRRYLDWLSILDNPKKFEAAKKAYMEAISFIGLYSEKQITKLIENLSPLKTLSFLDKRLNDSFNYSISFEKLIHIRNTYGAALTFDGFNHMGYKQLKWLESTREVLQDVIEFSGWKGFLLLKIKSLSAYLLPHSLNTNLQTELNYAQLDRQALFVLIGNYITKEDPNITYPLLQTMVTANIIEKNILNEEVVVFPQIESCVKLNPQKAIELASKTGSERIIEKTCMALIKNDHPEEALELASTFIKNGSTSTFSNMVEELLKKNEVLRAIDFANLIPEKGLYRRFAFGDISIRLVEKDELPHALQVMKMSLDNLPVLFEYIVTSLVVNNLTDRAIKFTSLVGEEFHNDPYLNNEALQKKLLNIIEKSKA